MNVFGTSHTFTSLAGDTYGWWVHASNSAGDSGSAIGTNFTCVLPPPPAPDAPAVSPDIDPRTPGVQQRHGDTGTISWNAVSGATSYNFYSNTNVGPSCAAGCPLTGTQVGPGANNISYTAGNFWAYVTACNATVCSVPTPQSTTNFTILSNDAAFVSQRVKNQTNPTTLTIGRDQNFRAEITLQNTGTATWDDLSGYVLRSQNPPGNTTWRDASAVGFSEVQLTATNPLVSSVPPGGQVTFVGDPIAPATAGTYNFQWQMYRKTNTYGYFGAPSANVSITVPGPTSAVPIRVQLQIKARQHLPLQ